MATFCGIYEQISKAPGQATFEDMCEAFKTYDRDQTGIISAAQLRQLLVNLGDTLTEDQVDTILNPHEDANGNVSYQPLIKCLMGCQKKED